VARGATEGSARLHWWCFDLAGVRRVVAYRGGAQCQRDVLWVVRLWAGVLG